MQDRGCTIDRTGVHRIYAGDPPRKVSTNELVALADIFDVPVDELILPLPEALSRRARRLAERLLGIEERLIPFVLQFAEAEEKLIREILSRKFDDPTAYDVYVRSVPRRRGGARATWPYPGLREAYDEAIQVIAGAVNDHVLGMEGHRGVDPAAE
jgi:hypothetical protein